MSESAKTLILNSNKDNNFKAILNLKSNENSQIKFFNLKDKSRTFALGIKQESKVTKIPLLVDGDNCSFSVSNKINFAKSLSCAVVDVSNPFCPEIVLSGRENSNLENSKIEGAFMPEKPKDTSILYEEASGEEIEDLIDKNLEEDLHTTYFDACAKCKFREAFYNEGECLKQNEAKIASQENLEKDTKTREEESKSFYEQIKPQIDALFNKYEEYKLLEEIIPSSKWAKIVYDNEGNYYILGLIYKENQEVLYICYGVPSVGGNNPPDDIKEYAGWLPKDSNNVDGEGYFIVCQDAITGETLKVDLV